MSKTTVPAYATFLAAVAPLIKGLGLTPVDQGSFIKFEAPNGHKAYVAKQVSVLKRIDSTYQDSCLLPLAKKNGKIKGHVPADPQVFADHLRSMVTGSGLEATVRTNGQTKAQPVDILALMAAAAAPEQPELVLNDELEEAGDLEQEAGINEV